MTEQTVAGRIRGVVAAMTMAGALMWAPSAHAALITVDSVGDSFHVLFNGNVNQNNIADLSAEATFEVTAFSTNSISFKVTLENTTGSLGSGLGSRVSGLGFNTTPNLTAASSTGVFNVAVLGDQFPNQFGSLETCFKDGGGSSNCTGGGGGGIDNPNSGIFNIVLNFNGPITEFSFDRFGVRYQSITGTTAGTSGTGEGTIGDGPPPPAVPEPTSMVLLGTGLLGLVSRVRRRR